MSPTMRLMVAAFFAGPLASLALASEKPPYASDRPLSEATVFAPGVISGGDFDSHPAFTPDGRSLYFVRSAPNFKFWTIFVSHYAHGAWSTPQLAPFAGQYSDADPFITRDGSKLFFISDRPVDGKPHADTDIWFVERRGDGWGEPQHLGAPINSAGSEWYPTLADDGTLYFGSDRPGGLGQTDLYRARLVNGRYAQAENLGAPISSEHDEYEPYIAPDQSFLVFMACGRSDSLGGCDLYLSRNRDGAWSAPQNLGPKINAAANEYSPKLSPDGRYFFWTSSRNAFTRAPLPRRLDTAAMLQTLRGAGNGLPDIFEIDAAELGVEIGANTSPRRQPAG